MNPFRIAQWLLAGLLFIGNAASAQHLAFGSYLGGDSDDGVRDMALMPDGSVVLVGQTLSSDLATPDAFQTTRGDGWDGFIAIVSAQNELRYASYIGGPGTAHAVLNGVAVDSAGRILVAGNLTSTIDPQCLLARIDPSESGPAQLDYWREFGGSDNDGCNDVDVDDQDRAYVTGYTWSNNFPLINSISTFAGSSDAFVSRFDANGDLDWSSHIPAGSGYRSGEAINWFNGWIHMLVNVFDGNDSDAFVLRLDADATFPEAGEFITAIDGSGEDHAMGLIVGGAGKISVTGYSDSTDLATTAGVIGASHPGGTACWAARITTAGAIERLSYLPQADAVCNDVAIKGNRLWFVGHDDSAIRLSRTSLNLDLLDMEVAIAPMGAPVAGRAVAVRSNGKAVVVGDSGGGLPLTVDAFRTTNQHADVAIMEIGPETPALRVADCSVDEPRTSPVTCPVQVSLDHAPIRAVSFDWAALDDTATAGSDYSAAAGSVTIPAGHSSATLNIEVLPDETIEADETALVMLDAVTGPATVADNQADVLIRDNGGPLPTVSMPQVHVDEDVGQATVTILLSAPAPNGLVVSGDYGAYGSSAQPGFDFVAVNGQWSVAPGATSTSFEVPIIDDGLFEYTERLILYVENIENSAEVGNAPQSLLWIHDDDQAPTLTIEDGDCLEGDAGNLACDITIRLSGPSGTSVEGYFTTHDGSAIAGVDYVAVTAPTISLGKSSGKGADGTDPSSAYWYIDNGETSTTIQVDIVGDTTGEADESFHVEVVELDGIPDSGHDTAATLRIIDDDGERVFADGFESF